jgi:hypothetical protein
VSLYAPETLSCDHCRYVGPPRPETLHHLRAAAQVLSHSDLRGRQLSRAQRFAIGSAWISKGIYLLLLALLTLPFACTATFCTAMSAELEVWVILTIGFIPLLIMLASGGFGFWWIGLERSRLEAACAALPPRAPGEPACCHVCGAPLTPVPGASVARCGFCSADNVVSLGVIARMGQRQALVFDAYERSVQSHATSLRGAARTARRLILAGALLAPVAGVAFAFAIAVGLAAQHLPVDTNVEYVAVPTEYGRCVAKLRAAKDGTPVADFERDLPEGATNFTAPAPDAERWRATSLIGRTVHQTDSGRIAKVTGTHRTKLDEKMNLLAIEMPGRASSTQPVIGTCLYEGTPPKTLAPLESYLTQASALAIAGGELYALGGSVLYRVPIGGGSFVKVKDLGSRGRELATENQVFFVTTDSGIKRLEGDQLDLIATGTSLANLALHGEHVYYTDQGGLWRAPKAGGKHQSLATSVSAGAIAVDGEHVYWLSVEHKRVSRLGLVQGTPDAPEAIATEQELDPGAGILVDAARVYWVRKATTGSAHEIVAAPKAGGGAPAVIASPKLITGRITMGPEHLYYARGAGPHRPGAILEQPKAGGAPRAFGHGAISPLALTIESDAAYWLDDRERLLASAPLR